MAAQAGAVGGIGGDAGSVNVQSAGDIYWKYEINANGGNGGQGGNGGGYGGSNCAPAIAAPIAGSGAGGAKGGSGGDVNLLADGDILYTGAISILANGGTGGGGGDGGSECATNGLGGVGGQGGDGGYLSIGGDNITPVSTFHYAVDFNSRPGAGGNGGSGGDGGTDYTGCPSNGGCFGDEDIKRGVGRPGGQAGTAGGIGVIYVKVYASGGEISLVGINASTRPQTSIPHSGATGYAGETYDSNFASCTECGMYLAIREPLPGATQRRELPP